MSQTNMLQDRRPFAARRASPLSTFADHLKQPRFSEWFDAPEFEKFASDSF
jgi:hypothetical protein